MNPSTNELIDSTWEKLECEDNHLSFSRYFFKHRQNIKFKVNWHHVLIADTIERVISGELKNVTICVPPGSSKTELVVINLIARGLAINPRARFLHLSYSDDLALLNSQTARDLIKSEEFQNLWPLQISDDSKSKKRWNVVVDGKSAGGCYATSLSGQITGFRAGHMAPGFQGCFVAGTQVLTDQGSKAIDEIRAGDIVVSYNHALKVCEYKRVLATQENIRYDITETTTASGRKVRSTPCHRFYDGESYREISTFHSGEHIKTISRVALDEMHGMQTGIRKTSERISKSCKPKSVFHLLLKAMLRQASKNISSTQEIDYAKMSGLSDKLQAYQSYDPNLQSRMRKQTALETNARRWQFELQRVFQRLPGIFHKVSSSHQRARWPRMSDLLIKEKTCGASRGQFEAQSCGEQSSDVMSELSCHPPQIESDALSAIEEISKAPTKVYDIQVEGNHNFFAEGILVHNCILIDDPLKPDDAFSKTKVDAANRKLLTTVKSRKANPDTPIILIMQRIAELDPVGFIQAGNIPGDWTHIKIPAVIDEAYVNSLEERYQKMVERDADGRFSYWPYKERIDELMTMERGEGSDQTGSRISRHVFASQYMQNPVAIGGNIIKGEWFKSYSVLPRLRERKIFVDTAQKTKEANDYSVFQCWGRGYDGGIYLLDMIRGKWEAPELEKRAISFWQKHQAEQDTHMKGMLRQMIVEDKSSGTGLIQKIKLMNHIPIKGLERVKDKLTRVMDVVSYIESGMVYLPETAPFTHDFVQECEAFTADDSHAHDDQIDPMTDAIVDLLAAGNKLKMWENLIR